MQFSEQSSGFLPADLEALAKIRSRGPVFSLYLDLRREERDVSSLPERFDRLLRQAEQEAKLDQASEATRQQWKQEAQRLRSRLHMEPPPLAQGLAVFSSQAADLWRVYPLSVPVFDRLVGRTEPFVRPLQVLLGEFTCTLVVLIDSGSTRLIQVQMGSARELAHLQAVPVTGDDLEIGPRLYARSVAEQVESAWQQQPCGRLVSAGNQEMLDALREELPEPLRQRLTGQITLGPQAGMEEVLEQVQRFEASQERQLEAQTVEEIINKAKQNKAAVLGGEQSLLAVRDKRARLLVVEKGFHAPGGECMNCGFLGIRAEQQAAGRDSQQEVCPFCGMALRPEADVIEVALKRVLDQGGEIEVLRSTEALHALEEYGRIGALLREPGAPVVRDSATGRIIARDGEINYDVLRDETIEESFPASDPPGWTQ